MDGWIQLHRQLLDHWLWNQKRRYSHGEAWIDLLLRANYAAQTFWMDNEMVTVGRGEMITSEVKLAARWQWNRTTVRAFLGILGHEGMIVKRSTRKWTRIFIVNYDFFQGEGSTDGSGSRQLQNTNNKDNKAKKIRMLRTRETRKAEVENTDAFIQGLGDRHEVRVKA